MNSFLGADYSGIPQKPSDFMSLEGGLNRFRILGPMVSGWEQWFYQDENGNITDELKTSGDKNSRKVKPRYTKKVDGQPQPPESKYFWAFPVWNYAQSRVQVLKLTQKSIQGAIEKQLKDPDFADPTAYDFKVEKTGTTMMDTGYSTSVGKHSEMPDDAAERLEESFINLEGYFDGTDVFPK